MEYIFAKPGMSPAKIVKSVKDISGVCFVSVGMRDAGQSDYKNRLRIYDIKKLAPYYNQMGFFSAECHGGARWHVGIMNRRESPFEEIDILRKLMPNVLLQTLIRETNMWGYRPYPKNVIEYAVEKVDIDIWRCFSFLNDIRNMRPVAEIVMKRGKLFEPAISYTVTQWFDTKYYLKVVDNIVSLCGGTDEIVLCIKDMAGVGTVTSISELIDAIKQKYPELVIDYHRHITDGLAIPVILAAAKSGAKIIDVEEDTLVRFYGHSPMLAVESIFREHNIPVHLNRELAEKSVEKVREWIRDYDWAESPFRGFDQMVTKHKMPGGAFPSSFEQAEKGGFLALMPHILQVMSLYNQIVKYFDVTPGSQITWVTCSGIVNRYAKEKGESGVKHIIQLLKKFVEEKNQDFSSMEIDEQKELLELFRYAPGDFKNLILGRYGKLPVGWPDDWIYQSAFGDTWQEKLKERKETSPVESIPDENLNYIKKQLEVELGRIPNEKEFILYLMHPKDALDFIKFREKYGIVPLVLPTKVWREGLKKPGDKVDFELEGKPYCIELISIGGEKDGIVHVVLKINNKTMVFEVKTSRAKKSEVKKATKPNEIGAPISGTVWRIGNSKRGELKPGDIVREGEEIANLESMKMENIIIAPFDAQILEISVKLNQMVEEKQLLFVLQPSEKVHKEEENNINLEEVAPKLS
jgi:pyruvate carboxylase